MARGSAGVDPLLPPQRNRLLAGSIGAKRGHYSNCRPAARRRNCLIAAFAATRLNEACRRDRLARTRERSDRSDKIDIIAANDAKSRLHRRYTPRKPSSAG